MIGRNFYPNQYKRTAVPRINHNYLSDQFSDHQKILEKVAEVVRHGDFTLGQAVDRFEQDFLSVAGGRHAIGVGSGTDALFLSLKALGVGHGDEVITTAFTFYATVGAIVTAGARPVFVDIGPDYNILAADIEKCISSRTRAILPVHWAGVPCDMEAIGDVAKRHGLKVVADACHAIGATLDDRLIADWADLSCFSLHPLKNLNVWGDGGVIVTDNEDLAKQLSMLRNHGLVDRDTCNVWAYNSRLDTIQAVVAQYVLDHKLDHITARRRANAAAMDSALSAVPGVKLPPRAPNKVPAYHLYMARYDQRDRLQEYLLERGIDAKVHYPTPMHLQPAAKDFGYGRGDFPAAEALAASCLSLPVHEHVSDADIDFMATQIREFYAC
jgi:dTDP-4-amino-4,6-dideoxygalactose transaminase